MNESGLLDKKIFIQTWVIAPTTGAITPAYE
jgi:hypothetical protein